MKPPGRVGPGTRDLLLILLLLLACLALRLPALDRVALNPDESQYEATASYLLGTDRSAFSLTYGVPGTIALYKAVGTIFGPYSMEAMRFLVLCVCLGMAVLLYRILRDAGSPTGGFLAAIVFLHHNVAFEGLSANREWFASYFVLAGAALCLPAVAREGRPRLLLLLASGAVSGVALWFKLQAGYIVLAVPLFLLWSAWISGRWRRGAGDVLVYACGGLLATAVYLSLLAAGGGLSGYLEFMRTFFSGYVDQNAVAAAAGAVETGLFDRYLLGLPDRAVFVVAYLVAAMWLGGLAYRVVKRREAEGELFAGAVPALFFFYFVTAMLAVGMGRRFFLHYYLFMLPPVAALFGLAAALFLRRAVQETPRRIAACVVVVVLLADIVLRLRIDPLPRLVDHWPSTAPALVFLLLVALLLGYGLTRPLRRVSEVALGLLLLGAGLLVVETQLAPPPRSLPHHREGYPRLVEQLRQRARTGDRLFVWGWAPEIYSLARLEAASHFTITQYIVEDYDARPRPRGDLRVNEHYAERLMADLTEREPRLIVDAWKRSWTMAAPGDPSVYRLERYPDFELRAFLAAHYDRVGSYDGCDLYVRRAGEDPGSGDQSTGSGARGGDDTPASR